ncbi:unnamed protein product [Chironomus riparius]|uniref:Ionotropic receptor n=1 Tax=Chironomus riparius TaxID=315576 RepID=A0A9N9RWW8_9DIPT|nr:unnamed protein product [Chironomus riparius]
MHINLILNINAYFFEDQFSLTIIDSSEDPTISALKCIGGNDFRPLSIFDDVLQIDLGDETDTSSVSSYPTTSGMFVKSGYDDALGILRIIGGHNPRSKVLLYVTDGNETDSMDLLKTAYEDLKMLNLAVLMINLEKDEDDVTIRGLVRIIFFNPFSGDKEIREPEYLRLTLTPFNLDGKFKVITKFIHERVSNLHQFPLRVNIFDFPMISKREADESDETMYYSYSDGETIRIIGEKLNFNIIYEDSSDGIQYGFQNDEGNFTGSLGALEYDQVDLLGNPRLIADYNTTKSLFLQPITMMRLSFIIKKRPTYKLLSVFIYSGYDKISMILGISVSVSLPFVYVFINKNEVKIINRNVSKKKRLTSSSFIKSSLYIIALVHGISMSHSKGNASRIVVGITLLYTLIVSSLYQSAQTKNLNTNKVYGKITTIDGLITENFEIGMPPDITTIFRNKNSKNKVTTLIENSGLSFEDIKLSHEYFAEQLMNNAKFAYLWSDLYVDNYLNQFYDPNTGENLLENIPEIAYEFYISLMAPKNSPFIEKFNEILLQYVETGIVDYHSNRALADNDMIWIQRVLKGEIPENAAQAIKMSELMPLFEIYIYLVIASSIVFVLEILWQPRKFLKILRKRPNSVKYFEFVN